MTGRTPACGGPTSFIATSSCVRAANEARPTPLAGDASAPHCGCCQGLYFLAVWDQSSAAAIGSSNQPERCAATYLARVFANIPPLASSIEWTARCCSPIQRTTWE